MIRNLLIDLRDYSHSFSTSDSTSKCLSLYFILNFFVNRDVGTQGMVFSKAPM